MNTRQIRIGKQKNDKVLYKRPYHHFISDNHLLQRYFLITSTSYF